MPQAQLIALPGGPPVEDTIAFHCHVLRALNQGGVRFLVGGAYAFAAHTGIERPTKDLDLFVARRDVEAACAVLEAEGFETDLTYPHWLAKVHNGSTFSDLIFNSGIGVAIVRAEAHAPAPQIAVCSGTLLSREQYLDDVAQRGYQDGRVAPFGNMSDAEVEHWTRSIPARMGDGG